MLDILHIENIALIKELDIRFRDGFTVFTGETGAGKSIIIDSINLLLGEKPQKGLIRKGETSAYVSALFYDIPKEKQAELAGAGAEPDPDSGELLIERTVSEGRSSAKINGRTVTAAMLRDIAGRLINIHGQHASEALLNSKNHERLLDAYADNAHLLSAYRALYTKINSIAGEIKSLSRDETEKKRTAELLSYQIKDIDSAKLKPGEEDALIRRRDALRNVHKIAKSVKTVYRSLYRSEKLPAACDRIAGAIEALEGVTEEIPEAQSYIQRLQTYSYEIEDIALSMRAHLNGIGENPEEALSEVEGRLDAIIKLKRKYGATVEEVLAYRAKIAKELEDTENADERIRDLKRELKVLIEAARKAAEELSKSRHAAAERLREKMLSELRYLDMEKVDFAVSLRDTGGQFRAGGMDVIEFLIATNKGEALMPLDKIASGGELSRIMLAMKSIFTGKDGIGTVIYDEIDTGISGATSERIGIKLKNAAKYSQVIAVTHSAQIAANADNHLYIYKEEDVERTYTRVKELDDPARIEEIARIMGGIHKSETLYRSAKELLEAGKKQNASSDD